LDSFWGPHRGYYLGSRITPQNFNHTLPRGFPPRGRSREVVENRKDFSRRSPARLGGRNVSARRRGKKPPPFSPEGPPPDLPPSPFALFGGQCPLYFALPMGPDIRGDEPLSMRGIPLMGRDPITSMHYSEHKNPILWGYSPIYWWCFGQK
jgi:hypothetical protein